MAATFNFKSIFSADSSEFVKGAKDVRQNLKDLDKVGNDSLASIGNLFGVNTEKIQKMASAASGLGEQLSKSGKEGVASFGNLLKSVDMLSVGIASIGLGGIITGFKLLNEEAEAFKQTIEGANLALQTEAFISTYQQVLRDIDASFGKTTAEGMAETEKWYKKLWALSKNTALNVVTGKSSGLGNAIGMAIEKDKIATGIGQEAWKIQGKINDALDKQRENQVIIAKYDAQIAQLREEAVDPSKTLEERANAIAEAQQLIEQKYARLISAQQSLVTAMGEMHELATDSKEAYEGLLNAQVQLEQLNKQQADEKKSIVRTEKSITKEAEAQAAAYQKAADARAAMAAKRAELASLDLSISESTKSNIQSAIDTQLDKDLTIEGKIIPKVDKKAAEEAMADFTPIVASGLETLGEAFGNMITDISNGGNVWSNFSNTAISAMGDMAIAVGKMAIATGTASLGIKAALESLNGYAAIAAGVALVALGTAVKQGMSNIANGNYSASSNVASSGSYGGSSLGDYYQREIDVNISGTFTASGNSLVAVLDNENKRKNHTC